MTQKNNIDGILLLDKPMKMSSNQAIQKVKKKFNIKKIGHTGTLDPLATGLLPICMGRATRISRFLIDSDKTYQAKIKLGAKTSTADKEGEIIETSEVVITHDSLRIDQLLQSFIGIQEQIPPMYSALKHKGKRLYKLALQGVEVPRKARQIQIYSIKLLSNSENYIELIIECSKGTYIRTLAEDIANKLGTIGHIDELRRLDINCFDKSQMHTFDKIMDSSTIDQYLLPMDTPLKHLMKMVVGKSESKMFMNGVSLSAKLTSIKDSDYIRIYNDEKIFLGLGSYSDGFISPKIVFNEMI